MGGTRKGNILNWDLLNSANYDDFDSVKSLLVCYKLYEREMIKGDTVAAAVWVDLDTAIHKKGLLTAKQMEVVELICFHNMAITAVAEYLKVKQATTTVMFNRAVNRIQKVLLNGKLYHKNGYEIDCFASYNIEGEYN